MNKVLELGRLTKDPELNFAANSGTAVCRFSIAVQRPRSKDESDFFNCVAFGKTAETIAKFFKKGQRILIEGELRTGSYDAKDGSKRYTTDIIVNTFNFIDYTKQNDELTGDSNFSENNNFSGMDFSEDMTPIDDGDMPF